MIEAKPKLTNTPLRKTKRLGCCGGTRKHRSSCHWYACHWHEVERDCGAALEAQEAARPKRLAKLDS